MDKLLTLAENFSTTANKKHDGQGKHLEDSGVQEHKRRNVKLKVQPNLKITFENFEFRNDVCTRGRPDHKLLNDICVDQIARQFF